MRLAMEQKNGREFMGRPLRIKKAVSALRLEKKRTKKEAVERAEKMAEKAAGRAERAEREDLMKLGDFEN